MESYILEEGVTSLARVSVASISQRRQRPLTGIVAISPNQPSSFKKATKLLPLYIRKYRSSLFDFKNQPNRTSAIQSLFRIEGISPSLFISFLPSFLPFFYHHNLLIFLSFFLPLLYIRSNELLKEKNKLQLHRTIGQTHLSLFI